MSSSARVAAGVDPWTLRIYGAVPVAPVWAGAALAALLLAALLGSELALGRLASEGRNARLAALHILLFAYFPTAYVYVILWSRRTLHDLRSALDCSDSELRRLAEQVGHYPGWHLALAGLAMVGVSALVTIATSPSAVSPWAWSQLSLEVRWHRVLAPPLSWWVGCCLYAVIVESRRFSRLAAKLREIDLLDLRPLMPFTRLGLANALLVVGGVSIYSLFLVEPGFFGVVAPMWMGAALFASAGFALPIRGVHGRIRAAKRRELDWCLDAMRSARAQLKQGADGEPRRRLDEVVAYRQIVESTHGWPFDTPTLLRFVLYLLIPLGSWSGGALVERWVDALLN